MTRKLSAADLAIVPGRLQLSYPDKGDTWGTLKEARDSCFNRGDVIPVLDGERVFQAIVLQSRRHHSDYSGDWIAVYKVRPYNRDGALSQLFRLIFPGAIQRGFDAQITV